jgi:hypothetical protein
MLFGISGHAIWYQRTCYLVSADMLFGIVKYKLYYYNKQNIEFNKYGITVSKTDMLFGISGHAIWYQRTCYLVL